jgi:hypothetical protein
MLTEQQQISSVLDAFKLLISLRADQVSPMYRVAYTGGQYVMESVYAIVTGEGRVIKLGKDYWEQLCAPSTKQCMYDLEQEGLQPTQELALAACRVKLDLCRLDAQAKVNAAQLKLQRVKGQLAKLEMLAERLKTTGGSDV